MATQSNKTARRTSHKTSRRTVKKAAKSPRTLTGKGKSSRGRTTARSSRTTPKSVAKPASKTKVLSKAVAKPAAATPVKAVNAVNARPGKAVEKATSKAVAKQVSRIAADIAAKAAAKEAIKAKAGSSKINDGKPVVKVELSESALTALTMMRTFSPPVQPVELAMDEAPAKTTHKYQVGDAVYFTSPSFGRAAASGAYTVIKVLPSDGEDRQYRIKSSVEAFERVAKESQLERI